MLSVPELQLPKNKIFVRTADMFIVKPHCSEQSCQFVDFSSSSCPSKDGGLIATRCGADVGSVTLLGSVEQASRAVGCWEQTLNAVSQSCISSGCKIVCAHILCCCLMQIVIVYCCHHLRCHRHLLFMWFPSSMSGNGPDARSMSCCYIVFACTTATKYAVQPLLRRDNIAGSQEIAS